MIEHGAGLLSYVHGNIQEIFRATLLPNIHVKGPKCLTL
jgi:hypothetical protein